MPNSKDSHDFLIGEPKEYGVWKPMHKGAPNVALHYSKLVRMGKNTVDGCIHLEP